MTKPDYFNGPERIGDFLPHAKKMRFGNPQDLLVSNRQKMLQFIAAKDKDNALAYLAIIHGGDLGMMGLMLEWSFQFSTSLQTIHPTANFEMIARDAMESYRKELPVLAVDKASQNVVTFFTPFFTLERCLPGKAQALRDGKVSDRDDVLALLIKPHAKLVSEITDGQWDKALVTYEEYFATARTTHDALVLFTSVYPTTVLNNYGQAIAEKLEQNSYESCSHFGPVWESSNSMTPNDLAAFLAEHLRDHYAGFNREGATRVVEDEDKVRLIFEPCGSGGALRQRGAVKPLPEATGMTWNRAGEVPLYCTHCARNSQHSIETYGYPKYVTEFNPDPTKPCGWTIYKDPNKIPDKYFEDVGMKKDPSKFR